MALVFTFNIPEIVSPGTSTDLEYVLKLKEYIFSSLQNSLSCQAE